MNRLIGVSLVLAACSSPTRETQLERELQRTAQLARLAFDHGETSRARSQFRRVLDLARLSDDPLAIGNASYNLALLHAEDGDLAAAELLVKDSEAALLRAGEPLADPRLLQAKCAWLRGDAQACMRALDAALLAPGSKPTDAHRFEAMLLQGHLAADGADLVNAQAALESARRIERDGRQAAVDPGWIALAGRIELLQGRPRAAAELFDSEAEIHKRDGNFRRMTQALVRAAEAFAVASEWSLAGDRFVRAAHTRFAAGDTDQALAFAAWAKQVAARGSDPDLVARVASLERTLGKAAESRPADSRPR